MKSEILNLIIAGSYLPIIFAFVFLCRGLLFSAENTDAMRKNIN